MTAEREGYRAMTTKRTMRDVAELAFRRINDDAPADVPTWKRLHRVEREHLIRFARAVLDIAGEDVGPEMKKPEWGLCPMCSGRKTLDAWAYYGGLAGTRFIPCPTCQPKEGARRP